MELIRKYINEKGKEYGVYKEVCPRCGGAGGSDTAGWQYYNAGACFKCEGKGYILTEKRILTEKEQQQRDKAKANKEAKKQIETLENELSRMQKANEDDKVKAGFKNGYVFAVTGNTYEIKEELKAAGSKFNSELRTWTFEEDNNAYKCVKVSYEDITETYKPWDNKELYRTTIKVEKLLKVRDQILNYDNYNTVSEYLETKNNKFDNLECKLVKVKELYSQHGTTYKYHFISGNYNLVWSTNKDLEIKTNDTVTLKGSIKEYTEHEGLKYTLITRCKIL